MPKKRNLSDEDKAIFREATRGIKPLSHNKVSLNTAPIKSKPKKNSTETITETFPFSDYENLPIASSEEHLQFSRPGLQHKMLRNLRTGQYNVDATLDLHGKTVEEARTALSDFLQFCASQNRRHLLIIHGKGHGDKPILKNKLNNWLRQTEQVLAFCSATPKHGGKGALYVLLRR